jgi:hypothetical protein
MRRPFLKIAVVVSMAATIIGIQTPAANAAAVDVFCAAASIHQRFEPGLRFIPRQVTVHEDQFWTGCVSTTVPAIRSADAHFEGEGVLSCIAGNADGDVHVKWRDEHGHVVGTSLVRIDFAIVARPDGQNVAAAVGHVTTGLFHGDTVLTDEVLLTDPLACLSPKGAQEQFGVGVGMTFAG